MEMLRTTRIAGHAKSGWPTGKGESAGAVLSLVFTPAHEVAPLAVQNQPITYGVLFRASAGALLESPPTLNVWE
jgi:hypothetical protein